jgi:hypothetical protein
MVLSPTVAVRGQDSVIAVRGVAGPSVEARLDGATTHLGRLIPWTRLRLVGGAWRGILRAPEFRGIYPVEIRLAGTRVLRSRRWLLRVFAHGTKTRPGFATPSAAARSWIGTLPYPAQIVAMKSWRRPDFDHRDAKLHRLFVLAYSRVGDNNVDHRLGIFVTAVRDGYSGPWRMLEATLAP